MSEQNNPNESEEQAPNQEEVEVPQPEQDAPVDDDRTETLNPNEGGSAPVETTPTAPQDQNESD